MRKRKPEEPPKSEALRQLIASAMGAHDPLDPAYAMCESEAEQVVRAILHSLSQQSPEADRVVQGII